MTLTTRMMVAVAGIAGTLAGTLGIALAQAPQTAPRPAPAGPGLDLVMERCGSCHPPTQALGARKSRADWTTTVQAMIDRGAELSPEEQGIVIDYLATNFAPTGAPATPAAGATAAPPAKN